MKKVAAPVLNEDESICDDDSDVHEDIVLFGDMTEECDPKNALRKANLATEEADLRKELIEGFRDTLDGMFSAKRVSD